MIYYYLGTSLLLSISAFALPLSNSTTHGVAPAFVPNPPGRGTANILLSCIITLGLCIWTAVHPDVVANKTTLGHLIYKTNWMLAALFVPEIVVSNSFHQWREAHRLHTAWRNLTKVKKGSKNDMGLEGAFFVVMGGCTVGGVVDGYTAILTPAGFLKLTETKVLPPDILSRDAIIDKGKADALAKLLVCLQSVWLAVQCATRFVCGLPVTLLEYHVVIQVGYAIAMYYFWWLKPKDVNEPIEVLQWSQIADPADPALLSVVKMVPQSKRFIVDELVSSGFDGHTDALTAAVLGLPTSGFHLLAWNRHFPSAPEKWIWRICSIGIGVAPICMYAHFVVSKHIVNYIWGSAVGDPLWRRVHKLIMDKFQKAPGSYRIINSPLEMRPTEMLFYVTTWLNIHSYSAFSVLLGVVAFLSLRSVPEGSYETVVWGNYWPHL